MSTAEDLKSRIGELPRQIRRQWPWQTLGRRQTSKASGELIDSEDDAFSLGSLNSLSSSLPAPFEDKSGFCIGSIFGLDVGGTLAKLVYFEEVKVKSNESENSSSDHNVFTRHERHSSYAGPGSPGIMSEVDLRSLHALAPEYRNTTTVEPEKRHSEPRSSSMGDLRKSYSDEFPVTNTSSVLFENEELSRQPTEDGFKPGTVSEDAAKPVPKVHSMFDLQFTIRDREEALDRFYNFAKHLDTFTRDGVRDHKLRFYSRELGGYFHFIHFVSYPYNVTDSVEI